jgi:hypothetical protein
MKLKEIINSSNRIVILPFVAVVISGFIEEEGFMDVVVELESGLHIASHGEP